MIRQQAQSDLNLYNIAGNTVEETCYKKYVILCCLCGGLNATIGSLFLAIHAVLSAHTASLALFETVPSYIPGIMVNLSASKLIEISSLCN